MATQLVTLLALALQKAKKLQDNELCDLLLSLPNDSTLINDFKDLKAYLSQNNLIELYPNEKEWNSAIQLLDKSDELDIEILPITSEQYPKYLRVIDSPPPLLHIRGNRDCLKRLPGISVVGTRKVTKIGHTIAKRISTYLAENNWVVVSGLAIGVDAAAHLGALSVTGEGNTIAVLAHGLEEPKPVKNKGLGYEILDRGGLWVSEHAIGVPAKPNHFVPRNRIQLGLSVGSIIIEAEPNSGSVTQAKFCLKQKRPLYAVVPENDENSLKLLCSGTLMMVNEMGAHPIRSKKDYPNMLSRFEKQRLIMSSI